MALLNVTNLSEQQSILGEIDSFITMLEKVPEGRECRVDLKMKPLDFLYSILEKCYNRKKEGSLEEALQGWCVKYVKYIVPTLEMSVKTILLANLKTELTSCSIDPRIPDYLRNPNEGFRVRPEQIDVFNILNKSPFIKSSTVTENGETSSETKEDNRTPYSLLRSDNFNEFLWYVIHRGKYPIINEINEEGSLYDFFSKNYDATILPKDATVNKTFTIFYKNNNKIINPGIGFRQVLNGKQSKMISVFADDYDGFKKFHSFSVGEYWDRTVYYINSENRIGRWYGGNTEKDLLQNKKNTRDYTKDKGLCYFKYTDGDIRYGVNNLKEFQIVVLPKPFIHLPHIGQRYFLPVPILFGEDGEPSKNGKFSVEVNKDIEDVYQKINNGEETVLAYALKEDTTKYVIVNSDGCYEIVDGINSGLTWDEQTKVSALPYMRETYNHLTIYELNYDFVMNTKFYDTETIIRQVLYSVLNIYDGFELGFSFTTNEIDDVTLDMILERMTDSEEYSYSDCFFSFDNSEYVRMQEESERKRKNRETFSSVNSAILGNLEDLIKSLNQTSDSKESEEIFSNIINIVSDNIEYVEVSEEGQNAYGYNKKVNILKRFLNGLYRALIKSLLSPAVMLIILMNKEMFKNSIYDGYSKAYFMNTFNVRTFIENNIGLFTAVIKEVRDMILEEFLKFVKTNLRELIDIIAFGLLKEQINIYRKMVKKAIEECSFDFSYDKGILNTDIYNVNYADIDRNNPTINKC